MTKQGKGKTADGYSSAEAALIERAFGPLIYEWNERLAAIAQSGREETTIRVWD
jgi:hypothetical protein